MNTFFGKYGTNENADALLEGRLEVDTLPLTVEAKEWLKTL